MPKTTQNYANHRAMDYLYFISGPILIIPLTFAVVAYRHELANPPTQWLAMAVILHLVVTAVVHIKLRRYALTLQDRIIRLEMRLRLERLLPQDLQPVISRLTLRQLIGLRFASDAELPELVRIVIEKNITDEDAIKRMVKDWQADFQRV
jgi:uncharacterized membrane protein